MSTWTKIEGATLSADLKSVEFQSAKIGNFYVEKAGAGPTPGSKLPVGGRIFYDNGPEADITYKFYKQDGTEIEYEYDSEDATHVVTALSDAYEYEIVDGKVPSVDRFYVFNNSLQTYKQWGKSGIETSITSDGIGLGKSNTKTALESYDDWEDNSIFAYIRDFNNDNETGCKDWYIGSKAEQGKLYAVQSTVSIKWEGKYIWSSVENSSTLAANWSFNRGDWLNSTKITAYFSYCCFAQRSF